MQSSCLCQEAVILLSPITVVWSKTSLKSLRGNVPGKVIITVISSGVVKEVRSGTESMAGDHPRIGKILRGISDSKEINHQGGG